MFNEPRKQSNEPIESRPVYDAQGWLIGYVGDKNDFGVKQVYDSNGSTLGWSKDASDGGGLPWTIDARGSRVSHGENPEFLLNPKRHFADLPDVHREHLERSREDEHDPKRWGL